MSLFEESVPQYRDWQAPPYAVAEDRRLGWLNEATEEGLAWLKSQRGAQDFRRAFDTLAGRDTGMAPADYRSKMNPNPLKRNVREVVGALGKLRPLWGYNSDNKAYRANANLMNKVMRAIYLEQMFDISIKDALAWASATCVGYIRPHYRRKLAGTGEGAIHLDSYGSPSVLPVQLPRDGDLQEAYAVTILDEMPIFKAHAMFPRFQERLRPSTARYWYANDAVRRASQGNWLRRAFGSIRKKGDETSQSELLLPIRYTYITDLSLNTTAAEIPMGDLDASWFYRVPALGQQIPTGFNSITNQIDYRQANENDARLYPRRRLIISTDTCIMYDGPAFDWHGMVPLVPFKLDPWPWEPLGFSLVHGGFEINEGIKVLERGFMDKQMAKLDPSLTFDDRVISMNDARAVDPFLPRGRYAVDASAMDGQMAFHPIVDSKILEVSASDLAHLQHLYERLDKQLGIADVVAFAKMRAVGSMDDLEKVMEANGPIVEDMSRGMEPPMRDLGNMTKYLVLQYMNTARVMQYVGEDNITEEVMDYDPTSLVPSHISGEDPGTGATPRPSAYSQIQRAKIFADNLRFFITPHSLHELTQMAMKLSLIQLRKAGIKIDSQTVAEAFNIPNYGNIEGSTVIERFQTEQEMDLEQAARMKQIAEEVGLAPPPGAGAPPPGAPKPGGAQPEGRPASFNAPPAIKSKDGGTRSTISTSK